MFCIKTENDIMFASSRSMRFDCGFSVRIQSARGRCRFLNLTTHYQNKTKKRTFLTFTILSGVWKQIKDTTKIATWWALLGNKHLEEIVIWDHRKQKNCIRVPDHFIDPCHVGYPSIYFVSAISIPNVTRRSSDRILEDQNMPFSWD